MRRTLRCGSWVLWVVAATAQTVTWQQALRQAEPWHAGAEAVRIADQLLLYQHDNGGWEKNIDMAKPLGEAERKGVIALKRDDLGRTTIDNDATYTQMRFLARVHKATGADRYADAFRRGLEFLFKAQYANGGWPQFYPLREGYYSHITYNDDAMIGVMQTLRSIVKREPEYAFLSDAERARAAAALERGVRCILATQVKVGGKATVWCAQHDEKTLAPAAARTYEHPSLSGSESVGIVRFLMGIEKPSAEVVRAIESAIAWFEAVKIRGIRVQQQPAPGTPGGFDRVVVADPAAPPLWARFYQLGTDRPIFSGRDGVVKYRMSEIEHERRAGYRWYVDSPARLLAEDYPRWKGR